MAGSVDYDRVAERYDRTRGGIVTGGAWREPVTALAAPPLAGPVLDLGSGTGLWSGPLADWLAADVAAVEPSAGMRAAARRLHPHPRVHQVAGRGTALPLRPGVAGAAWLSTVVHHVGDLGACAREVRRVLAPGAPVLIRSAFPGRFEEGSDVVRFFPGAARALAHLPSVDAVTAAFEAAGFRFVSLQRVLDRPAISLAEWRRLLPDQRHSDSALVDLSDEEFAAGLAALDRAIAAGEEPRAVGLDLLALR